VFVLTGDEEGKREPDPVDALKKKKKGGGPENPGELKTRKENVEKNKRGWAVGF